MLARDFEHVEYWVFDLDNTLYPPEARLFDQIEVKMTAWVMNALGVDHAEADRLRSHYWAKYGTTLAGLMQEHQIDPAPYLTDVHDISFDTLTPAPDLRRAIESLPGRKIVYTNACVPYAERVLEARGLSGLFENIFGVENANFHPKPEHIAFETVFKAAGIKTDCAAMFEDDARNLVAPHAMGMRTVHVAPTHKPAKYIDHHTNNLTDFVASLSL